MLWLPEDCHLRLLAAAGVGNEALGECLQGNTDPEFSPWRENASKLSMLAHAPNPSVQELKQMNWPV